MVSDCGCGGRSKPTTKTVHVLTTPSGQMLEFDSKVDANAARTAVGGGSIATVQK